jgi:hypothetical protein
MDGRKGALVEINVQSGRFRESKKDPLKVPDRLIVRLNNDKCVVRVLKDGTRKRVVQRVRKVT